MTEELKVRISEPSSLAVGLGTKRDAINKESCEGWSDKVHQI